MTEVVTDPVATMRIDAIDASGRYRTDLGDIEALSESIADVGLIHPVAVTADGRLVAGGRRLAACAALGWGVIPVTVVRSIDDAAALLRAELDENTCRKAMTASEMVALGRALEDLHRPNAAANQGNAGQPRDRLDPGIQTVRVRERVGESLGISGATYERIKTLAADAENNALPDSRREAAAAAMQSIDKGAAVRSTYQEYRNTHAPDEAAKSAGPKKPIAKAAKASINTRRGQAQAAKSRERVIHVVSTLSGFCRGLDSIDAAYAAHAMPDGEMAAHVKSLTQSLSTLRNFRDTLKEQS